MTEKYLFRLIWVLQGLLCFYLCFSGTWVHVAVETNLPVFLVVPGYMLRLKRISGT